MLPCPALQVCCPALLVCCPALPVFISFHPGKVFLLSNLAFAVVQMRML